MYSTNGNKLKMCHKNNKTSEESNIHKLGVYGSFFCDSPWTLVDTAIKNMKHFEENPDFILWTG